MGEELDQERFLIREAVREKKAGGGVGGADRKKRNGC